jgi:hypothetical protein
VFSDNISVVGVSTSLTVGINSTFGGFVGPNYVRVVNGWANFLGLTIVIQPGSTIQLDFQTLITSPESGIYSVSVPVANQPLVSVRSCNPGEYHDEGLRKCAPCIAGSFSNVTNAAGCYACDIGRFAANPGQPQCDQCPLGRTQPHTGRPDCQECQINEYALGLACFPCPAGAVCAGGRIDARPGVYLYMQDENQGVRALVCGDGGRCLGGHACGGNATSGVINCCTPNRLPPLQNPLCALCLPGYVEWNSACVRCDDQYGAVLFWLLLLTWVYLLVFHRLSQTTRGETKIFITFTQLYVRLFSSQFGSISWFGLFDFDAPTMAGGRCVAPLNAAQKLLMGVIVPLVALGLLQINCVGHFLLARSIKRFPAFSPAAYVRTSIGVLLFSYNTMQAVLYKFFDCMDSGNGYVVRSEPSLSCSGPEYLALRPFFYILATFLGLTPIVSLAFLLFRRNHLLEPKYSRRFGIIYECYRPSTFFWEFILLARRTLLIGCAVLIPDHFGRYSALVIVGLAFLIVHMLTQPFVHDYENWFEMILLAVLCVVSASLTTKEFFTGAEQSGLAIAIYVPLITFCGFVIYRRSGQFVNKRTRHKNAIIELQRHSSS